jgi:hypothetical protein
MPGHKHPGDLSRRLSLPLLFKNIGLRKQRQAFATGFPTTGDCLLFGAWNNWEWHSLSTGDQPSGFSSDCAGRQWLNGDDPDVVLVHPPDCDATLLVEDLLEETHGLGPAWRQRRRMVWEPEGATLPATRLVQAALLFSVGSAGGGIRRGL